MVTTLARSVLRRLLGTTQLTAQQWGAALLAAMALLPAWELGKWTVRLRATPSPDLSAPTA